MVTSTPAERATSAAASRVASTSSRGLIVHCRSSGAWRRSSDSRWEETGSYALTSSTFAPTSFARSTACCTACPAVSEPSVPTTIDLNIPTSSPRRLAVRCRSRRDHTRMAHAELIDDLAAAAELAAPWDELAQAASLPLCAPGWMLSWWRHMAPEGSELRVIAVRDGEALVALAPWFAGRGPRGRVDMRFLGAQIS